MPSGTEGGAILIVDDDSCFRRALAIALRLEGFQVSEAAGSADALALARGKTFDLALVDLLLGAERGEAILEALGRSCPHTRLASMSGRPGLVSAQALPGSPRHLEKPIAVSAVLDLLKAG